mmetsp:Transcript_5426/g.12258  ORF Transcript_5426/g.12258 Transcript_5426/m.12258 type:complete len:99 (-) Transcript_5426:529-825(-)
MINLTCSYDHTSRFRILMKIPTRLRKALKLGTCQLLHFRLRLLPRDAEALRRIHVSLACCNQPLQIAPMIRGENNQSVGSTVVVAANKALVDLLQYLL